MKVFIKGYSTTAGFRVLTYKYGVDALVCVELCSQVLYEPYRLICRWLNVKRPGRCAPWGAQGVDTAYGSPYKGQTIRQSDVRPEACGASFQTKRTQNICMRSFLYSNNVVPTI